MLPRRPAPPPRRARAVARDEATAAAALAGLRGKPARPATAPPKAGALAFALVKPLLKDAGPSLAELKRRWPEIVGERLATQTAPEKLVREKDGYVLTINAAASAAPLVQHQERLMRERLSLAGAPVARILIRQVGAARPLGNVRPFTTALSAEEERALTQGLARVEDDRLKDALTRLGRAVATRG